MRLYDEHTIVMTKNISVFANRESDGTTCEAFVMKVEEQPLVIDFYDGTPYMMKVVCTV